MVAPDQGLGRRQDVLLLKQKLADALGDNGPLYWQSLGDFVTGKLNRQEFDFYANLYLDRKNGKVSQRLHTGPNASPPSQRLYPCQYPQCSS